MAETKGSIFSVDQNETLNTKRWQRVLNFTRVPFWFSVNTIFLYIKKALGIAGSEKENAGNYYFLTLINADAQSVGIQDDSYKFKNKAGIVFTARKNPSSDLEVFNQVWGRDEYSKAAELVDRKNPDKELIMIDAGANVGYTALFFYHFFPGARIIAIEPDPGNFSILEKNILQNQPNKITAIKAGIWSHRCNLLVDKSFRDNREWSIQVKEVEKETDLQGLHILDIMQDHGIEQIDLLKIDIEGAEKYLFDDSPRAKEFLSKTNVLALEIHEEEISRQYVHDILSSNGFTYFDYSDLTIASKRVGKD